MRARHTFLWIGLCCVLFAAFSISWAQQNPPPGNDNPADMRVTVPVQELIARVDAALRVRDGLYTGKLSAVTKKGDSAVWDFDLYKKDGSSLFQFSSQRRGLEAKVLYREEGEEIWLWDALRNQLFRKRDFEKYEGILGTSFSFIDLSGYSFQASYNGRQAVLLRSENSIFTRLTLLPILESGYSRLAVLADQRASYRPIRIDFHNRDGLLLKAMQFGYDGELLLKTSGKAGAVDFPARVECVDLNSGLISRLEYFTYDESVVPGDALFDPDFLNR